MRSAIRHPTALACLALPLCILGSAAPEASGFFWEDACSGTGSRRTVVYEEIPNADFLDPALLAQDPAFARFVDPAHPDFVPELLDPRFNPEEVLETRKGDNFPRFDVLFDVPGPDGLVRTDDDPALDTLFPVLDDECRDLPRLANPFRGERPPTLAGVFRSDLALDPRLAALDGSTPHGLRLRGPAETVASEREFGQGLDPARKFRGFAGDFSGIVPFATPELVNIGDLTSRPRLPGAIRNASGRNDLVSCDASNPGPIGCPNGPEGPQGIDDPGFGGQQDGIFDLLPGSNVWIVAGFGELPLRPGPDRGNLDPTPNPQWRDAQGLYVPSRALRAALAAGDDDCFDLERPWRPDRCSPFGRTVDPDTGRPLVMRLPGEPPGHCRDPRPGPVDPGVDARLFSDAGAWQSMTPDGVGRDPACLKPGGAAGGPNANGFDGPGTSPQNALEHHPANQQLFARLCRASIGAPALDRGACNLSVFQGGRNIVVRFVDFGITEFSSAAFAGAPAANSVIKTLTQDRFETNQPGVPAPLASLNRDGGASDASLVPRDSRHCALPFCDPAGTGWSLDGRGGIGSDGVITSIDGNFNAFNDTPESVAAGCGLTNLAGCRVFSFLNQLEDSPTLDSALSNAQRMLLGCGPFAGTRCDSPDLVRIGGPTEPILLPGAGGVDLLLAHAGFQTQSFVADELTLLRHLTLEFLAEWDAAQADPDAPNRISNVAPEAAPVWLTTAGSLPQPGAIRIGDADGDGLGDVGPPHAACSVFDERSGRRVPLPGCRGIARLRITSTLGGSVGDGTRPTGFEVTFDRHYLPSIDGCVLGRDPARDASDPGGAPSDPLAQTSASDVRLTIADVPVSVVLEDGTAVRPSATIHPAATYAPESYAAELARQLHACADQVGTRFASTRKAPGGIDGINGFLTVQGAGTLWHPLAGCRDAGNLETSNGVVRGATAVDAISGADDGESCSVPLRDFTQSFHNDPMSVQIFRSEGAASSFNLLMLLVAISCLGDPQERIDAEDGCFDRLRPYRPDRCSLAAPGRCADVRDFLDLTLPDAHGERAFLWHAPGALAEALAAPVQGAEDESPVSPAAPGCRGDPQLALALLPLLALFGRGGRRPRSR